MTELSPMGEAVRRADPDRYLTALFAPPARREALFTLYAFNNETARAIAVSEPAMAAIRLQWWREVVEGTPRRHEVGTPLAALLAEGAVRAEDLLSVLDAREVTSIATAEEWRDWLLAGPGALAAAAAGLLGGDVAAARVLGAGYGAAGVLRSTPALARAGLCLLPSDVLDRHGLTPDTVLAAAPDSPALAPVYAVLATQGLALLGHPARRGAGLAAMLPAVLARRDLRQPGRGAPRGLADRLAVTTAALLGRA